MVQGEENLKERFVRTITADILAARYRIGERLPAERVLAKQMGISRTVVRSGIAELAAKGVVRIVPRQGSIVADYRSGGTISMISAMLTEGFTFYDDLLNDFISARYLLELETAALAAERRTKEGLMSIFSALQDEFEYESGDAERIASLAYTFHKAIILASGNLFYSIIINSMEKTYVQCLVRNYEAGLSWDEIRRRHSALFEAIRSKDPPLAKDKMKNVLDYRVRT